MNEQAAVMIRWLLDGNGGLKNIAQLLTDSFGEAGVAAASVDTSDGTIYAYPARPGSAPADDRWVAFDNGFSTPFDPPSMPSSATADHHVLAGVTSRNELLIVNLKAVNYLGIEGPNSLGVMRSWLLQVLSKTPEAAVAITDPDMAVPGAPRLTLVDDIVGAHPAPTIVFTTTHTSTPEAPHPVVVSSNAVAADNALLCDGAVSGIYLANRYWPLWRRLELSDAQWGSVTAALAAAAESGPEASEAPVPAHPHQKPSDEKENADSEAPQSAEAADASVHEAPVAADNGDKPAGEDENEGPAALEATHPEPDAVAALTQPEPTPLPASLPQPPRPDLLDAEPVATNGHHPVLPGDPADESRTPGIYVLGDTYVLGRDRDDTTGQLTEFSAAVRPGRARKPVLALVMLAAAPRGLSQPEFDRQLELTPANRRQIRQTIRNKMMGGNMPIVTNPATDRLIIDDSVYCDFREFVQLIGSSPATAADDDLLEGVRSASDEKLAAAVRLIRGAPFTGAPEEEYDKVRDIVVLKDKLLDACSEAALELARRQRSAGFAEQAHKTALVGLNAYPKREELWVIAAKTVAETERVGLAFDLNQAVPSPENPELRRLLADSRAR
ncbi:hypothetical protein ACNQVK_02030 [Mycobacterium sp. 134]|uniref:hypothetical protein n=1 Tax=Mycobacterium sp. 134 TaxID=3400425 RepID=UPI003AB03D3E